MNDVVKKRAISIAIMSFIMISGSYFLTSILNNLLGPNSVAGYGTVTIDDGDPLIHYMPFSFSQNSSSNPALFDTSGKLFSFNADLSTNTDGSMFLVGRDTDKYISSISPIIDGIPYQHSLPEDLKVDYMRSAKLSPNKQYLAVLTMDTSQSLAISEDGNTTRAVTHLYILDRSTGDWTKDVNSYLPEAERGLLEETSRLFASKEVIVQPEIAWIDSGQTNQLLGIYSIVRTYSGSSDNTVDDTIAHYTFDPQTRMMSASTPFDRSSVDELLVGIQKEDMSDFSSSQKIETQTSLSDRLSELLAAPLSTGFSSLALIGNFEATVVNHGSGWYFFDTGVNTAKSPNLAGVNTNSYFYANAPTIGRQHVTYVDRSSGEERAILSWFSVFDPSDVEVTFISGTDKVILEINERAGIYDIGAQAFRWFLLLEYHPGELFGDNRRPYEFSFPDIHWSDSEEEPY